MRTVLVMLAACGGGAAPVAPANTTQAGPRLAIARGQAMGWLGIAPVGAPAHAWQPVGPATVYLPADGTPAELAVAAIDAKGTTAAIRSTGRVEIPYGCDGNQLAAQAFAGAPGLAPGAVWILPPNLPATWHPTALAIATTQATTAARRYAAGPVTIELARADATHGSVALAWRGKVVHRGAFERTYMDGADRTPIDLTDGGIGVPEPIAAWQLGGERGAVLLVLYTQSYEGLHLRVIRVDEDGGRDEDAMATYLYQCAF
jgi:hypothetical protein